MALAIAGLPRILAAFCASFGTAAGLLVWPILLWIGWRERLNRRWLATLAGLGVIYTLFYARGLYFLGLVPALDKDAASFVSAAHLGRYLYYFFEFLGLPLTREPALGLTGPIVGVALFLAGQFAVLIATFSNRLSARLDRIAVGMILLAFGSAALAAVGRSDLIDGLKVPVRYTIFASALHVGLLCILLPRAVRQFDSNRGRILLCLTGFLLALILVVVQTFIGRSAAQIAAVIARDADCYAQGTQTAPVSTVVTRYPEDARRVLTALRQEGLLQPRSEGVHKSIAAAYIGQLTARKDAGDFPLRPSREMHTGQSMRRFWPASRSCASGFQSQKLNLRCLGQRGRRRIGGF